MMIAWIANGTDPELMNAFRVARCEINALSPLEFLQANPTRHTDVDLFVFELSDMMSLDLCRGICGKGIAPVLTIAPNLAYAQAALEDGADDFMVAPVDPIEALLRVRKLTQASNVIRVGNLQVDLAAWRVSNEGGCVQLSPVEFRLLACLAKRVGRLVSHSMILEDVWGWEAERAGLALVKSYVGRVRSKIEPDLRNPQYIISVPRAGYRLRNQRQWEENHREAGRSKARYYD